LSVQLPRSDEHHATAREHRSRREPNRAGADRSPQRLGLYCELIAMKLGRPVNWDVVQKICK